jgi:hypothetical protein
MVRKWVSAAVIGLAVAACGGDGRPGDDVVERDTTIMTRPDTFMVERTITEDTIRNPDLGRDTARDTLRRDTLNR